MEMKKISIPIVLGFIVVLAIVISVSSESTRVANEGGNTSVTNVSFTSPATAMTEVAAPNPYVNSATAVRNSTNGAALSIGTQTNVTSTGKFVFAGGLGLESAGIEADYTYGLNNMGSSTSVLVLLIPLLMAFILIAAMIGFKIKKK